MWFPFAARREPCVATVEPLLGGPGGGDRRGRRAALTRPDGGADEGMMTIVPGGLDEHAAEMRIAGFGDPPLPARAAAECSEGTRPT